jgi:hypothetical protein
MQAVSQQVANKKKPASTAQRASRSTAAVPSFIADSPRITAQRQQIGSAFGSALQAKPKEKPKQLMASANVLQAQGEEQSPARTNHTGLPDNLKSGIESLSGMSMDSVRVHYNSAQPAQLNALAYAQGTDIHVAPGQEQHLPHEAWHVVQQAQGRVQPTTQMKSGVPVNDDKGLEHEADVMGAKAMQQKSQTASLSSPVIASKQALQSMSKRVRRDKKREPTEEEIAEARQSGIENSKKVAAHGGNPHGKRVEVPKERQEQQAARDQAIAGEEAVQLRLQTNAVGNAHGHDKSSNPTQINSDICQLFSVKCDATLTYTKQNKEKTSGQVTGTAISNKGGESSPDIKCLKRHPQFPDTYNQKSYPNGDAAPKPFHCAEPKSVGDALSKIDPTPGNITGQPASKITDVAYNAVPVMGPGDTIEKIQGLSGGYYAGATLASIIPCPTCNEFISAFTQPAEGQKWK